ncbi:hypothetical protein [Amycolatopsis sp. H20-H5]|uniref:hypothetical protein n=1 Tax=Amycolatopsis sp. H20-H5 TaxID=3046309 RepID=UPI002DBB25CB|nr:hypothetical protein [Amycolatopsis sp. H20-H5]MEC3982110.1 hypothetical protein [Amycolatopsis sp. H20-H5]
MLAVSSAALTITAHAVADGGMPDPALTLLLTALIGWTAAALAGKARGPLATAAVLGGGQVVMHLVLTSLDTHAGMSGAAMGGGMTMTAAHGSATILLALLLARADALLLTVLSCLRALLPLVHRPLPVPVAAPSPVLALPAGPGHLLDVVLCRVQGRRGPPVWS